MTDAASTPARAAATTGAGTILHDDDAYTDSLIDFVTASPSSYHAATEVARRLDAAGFTRADETVSWEGGLPRRGRSSCQVMVSSARVKPASSRRRATSAAAW